MWLVEFETGWSGNVCVKEIARGVKLHNWCLNNNGNNNTITLIGNTFECQHREHDQHRRHAHTGPK